MLSKILTTAALVGLATTAATPSNPSRNFQLLQARQAAEAPKLAESGIVLLHTEPMPSGSFIEIYGSTNNRTSTPTASQEYQFAVQAPVYCGDERIKCGYNDAPGEDVTKQLIETLYANDEWTPWMPRSYCVYGNGSRACASWNQDIGTFAVAYLAPAAESIYKKCGAGRSGRAYGVRLGFHCVVQCLSNRPDGC